MSKAKASKASNPPPTSAKGGFDAKAWAKNGVSEEEVNQALIERLRQFPGQEKQVYDFYQENPQALLELRGPIFEQKVVDHIAGEATVTEAEVSKDELFRDPDEDAEEKPKKGGAKKKKASAKSASKKSEDDADEASGEENAPAAKKAE